MVQPPKATLIFFFLLLNQTGLTLHFCLYYLLGHTNVTVEMREESLFDLDLIGSWRGKKSKKKRRVMFPNQQNAAMQHF